MKYVISYAYDVPHYADFLVSAKDKKDALRKARRAFLSGKFASIQGQPDETTRNSRVFVHRPADEYDKGMASV